MSALRFLLSLVVVLAISLSLAPVASAQGDPLTYCSPVMVDLFSVAVVNGVDTESNNLFAQVNGSYPIQVYNYTLIGFGNQPRSINVPNVFFSIFLTPLSAINYTGTLGVTFTVSLNGVFRNTSNGQPQVFSPNATTGVSVLEFFNWNGTAGANSTNIFMLNVSETVTVGQDVTQCFYVYIINFLNANAAPPTGLNVVGSSSSSGGAVGSSSSSARSGVVGDPQFVGLKGQSFQVHGVDGAVYNLITDKSMQLNSRFTFLEGPRPCPVMPSTGKVSSACWSHPGSYLSELALRTVGGSQLLIVSGDAATGFASITLNGKALTEGSSEVLDFGETGLVGSVSVDNSWELTLQAGHFNVVIENNDGFVNLRQVSVPAASWGKLASHGLLGQTWQNKRYGGKIKEIEGDVDDYLVEDDNMFGTAFVYNRFAQ